MSVLVNQVCMNLEDFQAFKKDLEAVKEGTDYKYIHYGEKDHWTWPSLIVTVVTFGGNPHGAWQNIVECSHTSLSQAKLLKVLGLSQEEIKIQFDASSLELPMENIDTREV